MFIDFTTFEFELAFVLFCAFLIFEFAFARDAYDVDGDNMVKSSYFIYALRKVDIKTFLTNKK
jgi:hypothetical protein